MSHTETILLVILGFSLATLIALFIGRMMWGTAIRLGARRMRKQVPSSLVGLQTERDRLRAEYAMTSQRLGSKLEAAKLQLAEQMAEVSRHRNRLDLADRMVAERDAEVIRLAALAGELERRLTESTAQQVDLRMALAAKEEALRKVHRPHAGDAQVWTSPPYLEPELAEPRQETPVPVIDPEERLRQRIAKLNEMAAVRAREPAMPEANRPRTRAAPSPSDARIAERLAEAEQTNSDLQEELEQLDAAWSRHQQDQRPAQPAVDEKTEEDQGPRMVANVISLANRIRDLKKGLNGVP